MRSALRRHRIGGTCIPYRIPGTTRPLTYRARSENIDGSASSQKATLEFIDVHFVISNAESSSASYPIRVICVGNQSNNEHALIDIFDTDCLFCCFCNNRFIGLSIDHNLPASQSERVCHLQSASCLRRQPFSIWAVPTLRSCALSHRHDARHRTRGPRELSP